MNTSRRNGWKRDEVVVSELAGRSTLAMKATELGLELDSQAMASVLDSLKRLEYEGYHFEVADGSLELLLRNSTGWEQSFFDLESYRVISDQGDGQSTEATVKLMVGDERIVATAEGNGPVNALDGAVRKAIGPHFPGLAGVHLVDYRVRVLDSARGTGSVTGSSSTPRTGTGRGRPSASPRTSSPHPGRPSSIPSSTVCSIPVVHGRAGHRLKLRHPSGVAT